MDPITMALIMGGVGLAKGELLDRPAALQQQRMQAVKSIYAPWTGQHGDIAGVKPADPIGSAIEGGMSGYMLGENMNQSKYNKLANAYMLTDDPIMKDLLKKKMMDMGGNEYVNNKINKSSSYSSLLQNA